MSAQTKGVRDRHLSSTEGVHTVYANNPVIIHVFHLTDVRMAAQLDIEIRSLCGLWMPVDASEEGAARPLRRGERDCRRCARTRAYRRRQ